MPLSVGLRERTYSHSIGLQGLSVLFIGEAAQEGPVGLVLIIQTLPAQQTDVSHRILESGIKRLKNQAFFRLKDV